MMSVTGTDWLTSLRVSEELGGASVESKVVSASHKTETTELFLTLACRPYTLLTQRNSFRHLLIIGTAHVDV